MFGIYAMRASKSYREQERERAQKRKREREVKRKIAVALTANTVNFPTQTALCQE